MYEQSGQICSLTCIEKQFKVYKHTFTFYHLTVGILILTDITNAAPISSSLHLPCVERLEESLPTKR